MSDLFTPASPVAVTERTKGYLNQTKPWVRLMAVMTFIGAGFTVAAALVVFGLSVAGGAAAESLAGGVASGSLLALVYLAMGALYVAPGLFLWRYASAMGRLGQGGTVETLEDALMHQRSFWRYVGILTLIGTAVGLLTIALAVVVGLIAAMAR